MNVNIPRSLIDIELEDREAVFIAFMTMVSQKEGYESWFNFNGGDFTKLIAKQCASNINFHGPRTKKLRTIFDIAVVDENNVMVKWKINDTKHWHTRPSTRRESMGSRSAVKPFELTELYYIKLWCYLMGHIGSGNNLCSANDSIIHFDDSKFRGNGGVGVDFLQHENTKFH